MNPTLYQVYRGLEALYETDSGVDPRDLVHPQVDPRGEQQEVLLVRETESALEVALLLDPTVLDRFGPRSLVDDAHLSDALPVVEGLSHLCYLTEAARTERPVSALELETQAEVDKLALVLLSRWGRAHEEFDRLVDRLYYRFSLRPMEPALTQRYDTANRLALSFSRRLRPHVRARRLSSLRRTLREFWRSPMSKKRALAA